jgi:hypothetical protein
VPNRRRDEAYEHEGLSKDFPKVRRNAIHYGTKVDGASGITEDEEQRGDRWGREEWFVCLEGSVSEGG